MSEEPIYCPVQMIAPCRSYPYGQISEGWFKMEDGHVVLTTRDGKPRKDKKGKTIKQLIARGESPRRIAARLIKANIQSRNTDFNRKIVYPQTGWM
jgi:hypothetical protein